MESKPISSQCFLPILSNQLLLCFSAHLNVQSASALSRIGPALAHLLLLLFVRIAFLCDSSPFFIKLSLLFFSHTLKYIPKSLHTLVEPLWRGGVCRLNAEQSCDLNKNFILSHQPQQV